MLRGSNEPYYYFPPVKSSTCIARGEYSGNPRNLMIRIVSRDSGDDFLALRVWSRVARHPGFIFQSKEWMKISSRFHL